MTKILAAAALAMSATALLTLPAEARPKGQPKPKQECHYSTACIVLDGKKICSKVRVCNPPRVAS